jgi:hypothetical protein
MSRARNGGLPVLRMLVLGGQVALCTLACGGPQQLGPSGSVCFRADDCQAGLACVPQAKGSTKHVCSADLSGIVSMVDAGDAVPVGAAGATAGSAGSDGALAGAGGSGYGNPSGTSGESGTAAGGSPSGGEAATSTAGTGG